MLTIVGIVVFAVATYYVYKTAKDNGRNAIGWALATLAVGIGLQFILPLIIGIILGVYWLMTGSSAIEMQERIQTPAIYIGIFCLILSFLGIGLIMRFVSNIPEEKSFIPPPSPPQF